MKLMTSMMLAAAALLSACGGGGTTEPQVDLSPEAVTQSDGPAILSAPQQIVVGGSTISATAVMPKNYAQATGYEIPADQQGAYVEFQTTAPIDWSTVTLQAFARTRPGQADVMNTSGLPVRPSSGNPLAAYVFIGNQIGQQSLALKVKVGTAAAKWLRLRDSTCGYTHMVVTPTGLSCGANGPSAHPIFMPREDFSGISAALQTLLYRADGTTTENEVMTGMMTYGETDKIQARNGFSLLDAKRYLATRGYTASGYKVFEKQDYIGLLTEPGMGLISLLQIDGYKYFVWITAADDTYLYLASPHFGNLAISWANVPSEVVVMTVSSTPPQ